MLNSVPVSTEVTFSDILSGILEFDGMLSLEDQTLMLEYRTTGVRIFDKRSSGLQMVRIPLKDLLDVEYRERIVGSSITLRPRRLAAIEDIPGIQGGELKLRIRRRHRERAAALATEIQIAVTRSRTTTLGSIPFVLPSTSRDFAEIGGRLYVESEFLVFEILSELSSGSRKKDDTVKIEARALADIHLTESLLDDILYIRPKKEQLLNVIPGDHVDAVRLNINSAYRADVERLIAVVQDQMTAVDFNGDAEAVSDPDFDSDTDTDPDENY